MKPDFPVLKNISSTGFEILDPFTVSGKTVKHQLLCAQCYCSRPITMCSACSVPLCIPECYHNYHTSDPEHYVQVQQKKNELRSLKSFTQHETANLSTTRTKLIKFSFGQILFFHKHLQGIFFFNFLVYVWQQQTVMTATLVLKM